MEKTVLFECSPTALWDLLTNPEMTAQYMFGCRILSDWKIGSPAIWKGKNQEGEELIFVKGHVKEYSEGEKLVITMFDPNMGLEDVSENYVDLTYAIADTSEGTELTIIQDFAGVENATQRYDETVKGWEMIVPAMRALVS